MPDISIDRLTLHAPGFSEVEARRLALAVTEGLAGVRLPPGTAAPERIAVNAPAEAGKPRPERLADRIVAEILRQLERSQ